MRLPTLTLLAVVLAASCASEGPPRGATSVFLTIRSQSPTFVPDELRLSARTRDGSIFENQRLPEAGALVPVDGSVLGTVTLYVGQATGWLQIEVVGQVAGVPRWSGVGGVDLVSDHQVTAEVVLDVETPPVDAGADDGGAPDSGSADAPEEGGAEADAGTDAQPARDATTDRIEPDADSRDAAVDAYDGSGNAPDVVAMDLPPADRPADSVGGDGNLPDGGAPDASGPAPFLRLKFDETSGTTAADSSGNKHDGALLGAVTHVAAGRVGAAVHLDGTSGTYVALPQNLLDAVRDVTIALWVRVTTATNRTKVFDFGSGTTSDMGSGAARTMYLAGQWSGPMRFAITSSGAGGEQVLTGTAALAAGVWTHVAVVLGASGGTLYVNGAAVATSATVTLRPADLAPTPNVWLGRSQVTTTPYLDGDLDDFRIYDRALTAAEVAAVYGATQ